MYFAIVIDWHGMFVPSVHVLEIVLRKNLRREMLGMDDLASLLREKGIESPEEVKRGYLESDGELSVIRKAGTAESTRTPRGTAR